MGALPIVLYLAGFILLWSIVNYNSFKDKRDTIRQILGQRAELLRVRTEVLAKIATLFQKHNLALPQYFSELIKNPNMPSSKLQMEESLTQLNTTINTHLVILNTTTFQELRKNLVGNTNQVLKLQHSLNGLIASYNKHTTSMPYRIIATLFGFKPVKN